MGASCSWSHASVSSIFRTKVQYIWINMFDYLDVLLVTGICGIKSTECLTILIWGLGELLNRFYHFTTVIIIIRIKYPANFIKKSHGWIILATYTEVLKVGILGLKGYGSDFFIFSWEVLYL